MSITHTHNFDALANTAPGVTYTAGTATVLFWGLHLSDIAVILSTFATLCGVALQFYVVFNKISRLERQGFSKDKE